MAKQFKVTRKDGSEHIVPEGAVDGIKRLFAHEGKELQVVEHKAGAKIESQSKDKAGAKIE